MEKRMYYVAAAVLITYLSASANPIYLNGGGPAGIDPAITIDAGWYGFCFGASGSPATAGCQNEGVGVTGNDITFTAATNVLFKITDAFSTGDSFDVFINGPLAFTTPSVPTGGSCIADAANPDQAYGSTCYSHGFALLGPGAYTVDVFAHDSCCGGGGAYLQVVTASVPEPSSLLLVGTVLVGAVITMKRKLFS